MTTPLIIYADESDAKGAHFSNFYGGALVHASNREAISKALDVRKAQLNLNNELKWTRISENYAKKYMDFLDTFFDFVRDDMIKIRVMFTQNRFRATDLTQDHHENQYFILYYQFLKHAFGLQFCDIDPEKPLSIVVLLDEVPHNKTKLSRFRNYISSLSAFPPFQERNVLFPIEDIAEINSKEHSIAQGLDIILGGMSSRLNDKHTKPAIKGKRRTKKARAKELVFKHIQRRIWELYPRFNVGTSTATPNGPTDRWCHRYRHWLFVPSAHEVNPNYVRKRKNNSPRPTT